MISVPKCGKWDYGCLQIWEVGLWVSKKLGFFGYTNVGSGFCKTLCRPILNKTYIYNLYGYMSTLVMAIHRYTREITITGERIQYYVQWPTMAPMIYYPIDE